MGINMNRRNFSFIEEIKTKRMILINKNLVQKCIRVEIFVYKENFSR